MNVKIVKILDTNTMLMHIIALRILNQQMKNVRHIMDMEKMKMIKGMPCDYDGKCQKDCSRYLDDCDGMDLEEE